MPGGGSPVLPMDVGDVDCQSVSVVGRGGDDVSGSVEVEVELEGVVEVGVLGLVTVTGAAVLGAGDTGPPTPISALHPAPSVAAVKAAVILRACERT